MSIGPEVLNLVQKNLIAWRIYEAVEGEGEDAGEDKFDLTYFLSWDCFLSPCSWFTVYFIKVCGDALLGVLSSFGEPTVA